MTLEAHNDPVTLFFRSFKSYNHVVCLCFLCYCWCF